MIEYWAEILTAIGIILSMPLVTRGASGIWRALLLSAPYIVNLIILIANKLGWKKSIELKPEEKPENKIDGNKKSL